MDGTLASPLDLKDLCGCPLNPNDLLCFQQTSFTSNWKWQKSFGFEGLPSDLKTAPDLFMGYVCVAKNLLWPHSAPFPLQKLWWQHLPPPHPTSPNLDFEYWVYRFQLIHVNLPGNYIQHAHVSERIWPSVNIDLCSKWKMAGLESPPPAAGN